MTGEETIADDSGLCIDALDGFPGVMTHRFLGDYASDTMRNEYLINELNKYSNRSAQVICKLVYYNGKDIVVGEGVLKGFIAKECRGINGFGFDEIFELSNGLTLAELSADEKNKVSARGLAAKDLKKKFPFFMIEYTRTYKSLIKSYQQSVKDFMEFLFKEGLHIIIPPVVKLGSDTSATRIEDIDTTNRKIEYRLRKICYNKLANPNAEA